MVKNLIDGVKLQQSFLYVVFLTAINLCSIYVIFLLYVYKFTICSCHVLLKVYLLTYILNSNDHDAVFVVSLKC